MYIYMKSERKCALCDKQDNEQQQHKRQRGKSSLFFRTTRKYTHTYETNRDRQTENNNRIERAQTAVTCSRVIIINKRTE
jgi:hypothetical protein